jgi:DNA-binding transcriptional MerR regulator
MMTLLSPKDAATRLGLTCSGVRYLEFTGQLTPVRNSSGWRAYDPRAIARLVKTRRSAKPAK